MSNETPKSRECSSFDPNVLGEYIQKLQKEGRKHFVTFLVGAGFSRSSGIPGAGEIVKELRTQKDYSFLRDAGAPPPGMGEYAFIMDKLGSPKQRAEWVKKFVDRGRNEKGNLRINWAHLLLAAMADRNLVNCILTTNFDPLIVEALALTGQPIRTYDLSTIGHYHPGTLEPGSVIYLHGQMHGLLLANARGEMDRAKRHYPGVLQEAVQDSLLIVVGYAGECDPVLEALGELPGFPLGLWWSHYSPAGRKVCSGVKNIFAKHGNACHLTGDDDADTFMRKLVFDGLKLKLPDIVLAPFRAADEMLSRITPFPTKDYRGETTDLIQSARDLLQKAQETSQVTLRKAGSKTRKNTLAELSEIIAIRMAALLNDKSEVKQFSKMVSPDPKAPISRALGSAYCRLADSSYLAKHYDEAMDLLQRAEQYGVNGDWKGWLPVLSGKVLADKALLKGNTSQANKLFKQAYQKFAEAARIKPDDHGTYNSWGSALSEQAKLKGNTREADKLLEQAGQKYAVAVRIKPDNHAAFNNWGAALSEQAKLKGNTPEANKLFKQAYQKYAVAIRIKPDNLAAFNDWATALSEQAKLKGKTSAADKLLEQAGQKYAVAVRIRPDDHAAFYNWGTVLSEQAKLKGNTPEADKLLEQAGQKYAETVRFKPDKYEAFYRWGNVLSEQAKLKGNTPEADKLLEQAGQKYAEAVRFKPDKYEAFYRWGTVLSEQAKLKGNTPEADKLLEQAGQKYAEAVRLKPDKHEAFYNWGTVLSEQAKLKGNTPGADKLLEQAGQKYAEAVRLKPDKPEAFCNWGTVLSEQAKLKGNTPEADRLLERAGQKYAEAVPPQT